MIPINATAEKTIIANIDELVNLIIKISQSEKSSFLDGLREAEEIVLRTNPLLLELLDGKEELLEQMYRQLLTQKLPHPQTMKSFGDLEKIVEKILSLPIIKNTTSNNEQITTVKTATSPSQTLDTINNTKIATNPDIDPLHPEKTKIILDRFISILYPNEKIIKNHYIRSIKADYYLPKQKVAVFLKPKYYHRPTSLNLLARRDAIKLVEILPQDLSNLHLLSRKFPR